MAEADVIDCAVQAGVCGAVKFQRVVELIGVVVIASVLGLCQPHDVEGIIIQDVIVKVPGAGHEAVNVVTQIGDGQLVGIDILFCESLFVGIIVDKD